MGDENEELMVRGKVSKKRIPGGMKTFETERRNQWYKIFEIAWGVD
jgi:hypothetical protein